MQNDDSDDFLRSIRKRPLRYTAHPMFTENAVATGEFIVVDNRTNLQVSSHRSNSAAIRRAVEMNAKEEKGDAE